MKKILISAFALISFVSLPAWADKSAKAKELLGLMQFAKQINSTLEQQVFIPFECRFTIPESEKANARSAFRNAVDLKTLMESVAQFSIDRYTESELDDLISFYKTPTGQKSIKVQQEMSLVLPRKMEEWTKRTLPNLLAVTAEMTAKYPLRSESEIQTCIQSHQN